MGQFIGNTICFSICFGFKDFQDIQQTFYFLIWQRFPNQNVSQMQRTELLKLFAVYAVPKAQRNNSIIDIDMKSIDGASLKQENDHKRSRHQIITAPTVETVTNACKRIRLINTERGTRNTTTTKLLPQINGNSNKRQYEAVPMVCELYEYFLAIFRIFF